MNIADAGDANRRPLKMRSKRWVQALATTLARREVSPNAISSAGIVFAVIGGACLLLSPRAPVLLLGAAACVQLRLLCNLLDGLVAVEGGLKSRGGDLFNEMPDRVEDSVFLVCAGYAYSSSIPELGWASALLAVLTAYIRAFRVSLGLNQDFSGPMANRSACFVSPAAAWLGSPIHSFFVRHIR